jgi:hypothetical protein
MAAMRGFGGTLMRKLVIGLVVAAVVLGGGAYYGTVVYPQQRFEAALQRQLKQLPLGTSASYKTAKYAATSNTVELGYVAVHIASEPPIDITADAVEVARPALDLEARWRSAEANPSTLTPEAALPVADSVVMRGLSVRTTGGGGSIERFRIDGVRVYPWALLQKGVPTIAEATAEFAKLGQGSDGVPPPEEVLGILRAEAALLLGYSYDRYVAENAAMRFHVPAMPNPAALSGTSPASPGLLVRPTTLPAMDVAYTVRKLSDSGVDRGIFKEAVIEGINADFKPTGSMTIERATVSGFDLRKPLLAVSSGAPLSLEMLDGLTLGKVEYGNMSMQLQGVSYTLGTASVSGIRFVHGLPVSGGFAYSGLRMTRAQMSDPQAALAFDQLGLEAMTLSVGATYQWDPEQNHVALKDALVKIDELGALSLSVDIVDVTPTAAWQEQARLAHAVLRYDDASLTQRGLKAYAKMSGGANPEALRQQLIAMVDQQGPALGDSPPLIAALAAIRGFLGTPKSLIIELLPPEPVPLATLRGAAAIPPPELATLVGLTVSAGK